MSITVETVIPAPTSLVWECFTNPEHITGWNFASNDWHCPRAENDLCPGGKFSYRMEAKDGSFGFDLEGEFISLHAPDRLTYKLSDGRQVELKLSESDGQTMVAHTFEPETENSEALQRQGWQAILDQFRHYVNSRNSG